MVPKVPLGIIPGFRARITPEHPKIWPKPPPQKDQIFLLDPINVHIILKESKKRGKEKFMAARLIKGSNVHIYIWISGPCVLSSKTHHWAATRA